MSEYRISHFLWIAALAVPLPVSSFAEPGKPFFEPSTCEQSHAGNIVLAQSGFSTCVDAHGCNVQLKGCNISCNATYSSTDSRRGKCINQCGVSFASCVEEARNNCSN